MFGVFVAEMCIPGNGLILTLPLNLSYMSGLLFQENFKRAALLEQDPGNCQPLLVPTLALFKAQSLISNKMVARKMCEQIYLV